jgi:hypothetical protein
MLEPLPADDADVSAETLRDEARRQILARLGEPDLAVQRGSQRSALSRD